MTIVKRVTLKTNGIYETVTNGWHNKSDYSSKIKKRASKSTLFIFLQYNVCKGL